MGYEANYAGTSFLAPPRDVLRKLKYGPEWMNVQVRRVRPRRPYPSHPWGLPPPDPRFGPKGLVLNRRTG